MLSVVVLEIGRWTSRIRETELSLH
jgi:hypothetical protein